MAKPRMDLTSFVGKLLEQDDVDALREGVRILAQAVMETEFSSQIGALPLRAQLGAQRLQKHGRGVETPRASAFLRPFEEIT
jgi:hypothetical protein